MAKATIPVLIDWNSIKDYMAQNDVIQVVRCKDCKFSSPNQVYGCRINSFADDLDKRMYSDDFCSRAERRNNVTVD